MALLRKALGALIVYYWVTEEATKAHVAVTPHEVDHLLHRQFPTAASFHRFLGFTGMHASDERLLLEAEILRDKWQRTILPAYARLRRSRPPETMQMAAEIDSEVSMLSERMRKHWFPKTLCRTGYVVAGCSDFKG